MGGKLRPAVMAASAFALLAMASPVAVLTGPLAAHYVAAATGPSTSSLPVQIELSKPRPGQPSERADHASASSRGLHFGAATDPDETAGTEQATIAPTPAVSSGTRSAETQAASAPAVVRTSTPALGGTSTPPPVIVEPPAAPQPNPPLGTQPVLTGARLDWILVAVVIALAAAVVAAVRVATLRGRRPPR